MKTKACEHCAKVFERENRTWQNWRFAKYCSRTCQYAHMQKDPVDVFWSKVERRGDDECWGWKAQKRWDGYGRFRCLKGAAATSGYRYKAIFSHRFSYELHHGPIPAGMCVMHTCDRPECTNPRHLRIGTHQENMDDKKAKGRYRHKFSPVDELLHPERSKRINRGT